MIDARQIIGGHGLRRVWVVRDDGNHRVTLAEARRNGDTVYTCALCDRLAKTLDHLAPYCQQTNRCKWHKNEPSPHVDKTDDRISDLEAKLAEAEKRVTAPIVCMCGSTKFRQSWIAENARLTDEGNIVLAVGLWGHHNGGGFVWGPELTDERKAFLDGLHKRKIDLCDWVWVLDIGGYIGSSTRSEIEYAESLKKPVRYLSQEFPQYHEPADPLAEAMEVVRGVVRMENDNKLRNWYGQWYCACCGNLVECHAPDCLVTKAREIVRKVDGK